MGRADPAAALAAIIIALGAAAAAVPTATLAAQDTASVAGRVTDAGTGRPVEGATVAVVGTTRGAVTGIEGRYVVRGLRAGPATLRVVRIGYAEQKRTVALGGGAAATADFALAPVAITLSPVVTTVTGEQRRVEVGNAIARIDAAQIVDTRPVATVGELLDARTPGVTVLEGNSTGTGARVRIRGTNSLSLSNDPIYVIDGVRMESSTNSSSIGVGGSVPSRVDDINPEEIASLEVVRGPSAATLYGTDAANGVVVITTKRGRAGRPRWDFYTEQGAVTDRNTYPDAYSGFGTLASGAKTTTCFASSVARGACTQDSVTRYNIFENSRTSPLAAGYRDQYGAQLSGGSETVRYFLSGETESETGRFRMPDLFARRLESQGVAVLPEWRRPNALDKKSARANLNVAVSPALDLAVSTGYVSSSQRLPQNDNNTIGLLSNALGGPGFATNTLAGDSLYGYRRFTPDRMFQETVTQDVNRFLGALNANWRPLPWLSGRGNFGVDYTGRRDTDLCRFDTCVRAFEEDLGFKTDNRTSFFQYTTDVSATGTFQPRPWLNSRTTAGVQFFRNLFDRNGAAGSKLTPGGTTITQASVLTADEVTTETRTLGAFAEQSTSFNDRLFATLGLRADRNSAFGKDFKAVYYPKASVSYVLSEEPFFHRPAWLDQLRLRGAVGASGVQPGATDAVQFYIGRTTRLDGADTPGLTFGYLGNRALKPERTQEVELGVDGTFWGSRLDAELTYYDKNSRDALVQRVLPPSSGTDSTVVFDNIGRVRNAGLEGMVRAQLLQRRAFGWDVVVNGSTNANKIVSLGNIPPIVGTDVDQRAGFPLNAYFGETISYDDANHDGVLSASEVTVSADRHYLGYSSPRHEASLTNGFDFLSRRVRLTALLNYRGGYKLLNDTERIRCGSRRNCQGLVDPHAPLKDQARVIALRELNGTHAGFIEDASFLRLREVALTFTAPDRWARGVARATGLSATLSARNLHVWTKYSGIDPESNYGQLDIPNDFQTAPPPTLVTFRLNLRY